MIATAGEAEDGEVADRASGTISPRSPTAATATRPRRSSRGECDLALGNSYYVGLMLTNEKEPEQKEWASAIKVLFPNTKDRGTHVNISGMALAKNAPNKENAVKLMEFLSEGEAQKIYAEQVFEYPVLPGAEPSEIVKSFGEIAEEARHAAARRCRGKPQEGLGTRRQGRLQRRPAGLTGTRRMGGDRRRANARHFRPCRREVLPYFPFVADPVQDRLAPLPASRDAVEKMLVPPLSWGFVSRSSKKRAIAAGSKPAFIISSTECLSASASAEREWETVRGGRRPAPARFLGSRSGSSPATSMMEGGDAGGAIDLPEAVLVRDMADLVGQHAEDHLGVIRPRAPRARR